MVEWAKLNNEKGWVKIEHTMSNTQLGRNIWTPPQYRALGENTHTLTRIVFRLWDLTHKQNNWEYNSPLMALNENNYFAPGKSLVGGNWIKKENAQLRDIITSGENVFISRIKT